MLRLHVTFALSARSFHSPIQLAANYSQLTYSVNYPLYRKGIGLYVLKRSYL